MRVFGTVETKPVRTYNFKRGTIIDHRSGISVSLRRAMDGDIQPLIDSLIQGGRIPAAGSKSGQAEGAYNNTSYGRERLRI